MVSFYDTPPRKTSKSKSVKPSVNGGGIPVDLRRQVNEQIDSITEQMLLLERERFCALTYRKKDIDELLCSLKKKSQELTNFLGSQ